MIYFCIYTSVLMVIKGRKNHILLRFSILLVLLTATSYSKTDKLLQGQLLKDGMELVSAFGNFRLGFFSPRDSTNRYLGIYYQKNIDRTGWYTHDFLSTIQIGWSDFSDVRTINPSMWPRKHQAKKNLLPVWVANRNTPILDKSGILTIDSDGNLKILHSGGNPIVISSVQAEVNTSATLLKNGNFVLYEMNADGSERRMLWQSFDYPTDVLLPGMKLGINVQTGQQWFIRSWSIYTSPAEGSYTLGMDPNISNKLIIWKNAEVQWTSSLLPNNSIRFFSAGPSYYNFSYTSDERERYLTYSADEDAVSFPLIKILPIGGLIDDTGRSIRCITFGGCGEYRYLPNCWRPDVDIQVKYGYMDGPGFKFPESDNMTLNNCRSECLRNCSCIAYTTTNKYANTGCQIWSRGIKFMESYSDELAGKIYLLVERNGAEKNSWQRLHIAVLMAVCLLLSLAYLTRRKYKAKEETRWMSLSTVVGIALLVPLLCYSCFMLLKKLNTKVESIMNRQKLLRELGDNVPVPTIFGKTKTQAKDQNMKHDLKIFDFQTIAAATDNFSAANRLGQGGFGPVYMGKLLDGQEIAIKRLSKNSGQGIVEFKNEAKLIAKLQHTNLVRLLGCSLHGEERLLVYEYMPNKSLDFFIFDCSRKKLLNWKERFNIIEGIAQGLLYLHKYSRLRVIHRDLKASNVLLDDQMNPKISDFGMARTFGKNELETNTNRIVGTHGYMPPEYVMNGIVSVKSDVFSFGVLVLEIVCGKKNHGCYHPERPLNLIGYAWQLWDEGRGLELTDPILLDESCSHNEVLRCIHVGLLSVQDQATDRPTMSEVVSMLTTETMALPAPKKPGFFINVASDHQEAAVSEVKLEVFSPNVVTISEMEPR